MPTVKRIVCLANSRKRGGSCVAGKELAENHQPGRWVRPVSNRETEEVSEYERQYADGSGPRVLDIVNIPLLSARPKDHQQENWLLDPSGQWVRTGCFPVANLDRITDSVAPLWANGYRTYNGVNDRVPVAMASDLPDSLRLIKIDALTLVVFQPGLDFSNMRRRVQGRFSYAGVGYRLWVTDSVVEQEYLQKDNGEYMLGGFCYICGVGGSVP